MADESTNNDKELKNQVVKGTEDSSRVSKASGRTPDGVYHSFDVGTPKDATLYGRIPNRNKVVSLCFYKYQPKTFLAADLPKIIDYLRINETEWDNWKSGIKRDDNSILLPDVPPSVMPVADDLKIEGGYKYSTISATDAMKQGGGAILGNIRDIAKNAGSTLMSVNAAGRAIGKGINADGIGYATAAMDTTTKSGRALTVTSKIDNFGIYDADNVSYNDAKSLKLTFDFGCGGFYDGEIEVVRPIVALAAAMAPQFSDVKNNGRKHRLSLPGANPAQFYAATWGGTIGSGQDTLAAIFDGASQVGGAIGDMAGNIKEASGVAGTASAVGNGLLSISEKLVGIADDVVEATINGMEYAISAAAGITTVLFYRVGQYIAGPFQIESVNYDFDYSMVDEAGYPYKGNITFGLKNIYKPDAPDLMAQAGYIFGA